MHAGSSWASSRPRSRLRSRPSLSRPRSRPKSRPRSRGTRPPLPRRDPPSHRLNRMGLGWLFVSLAPQCRNLCPQALNFVLHVQLHGGAGRSDPGSVSFWHASHAFQFPAALGYVLNLSPARQTIA